MKKMKIQQLFLFPLIVVCMSACSKKSKTSSPAPASPMESVQEGVDGAMAYSSQCINPLLMEPVEGEKSLTLEQVIHESQQGNYELVSTEYFAEAEAPEGQPREQIHARGSEFKTPENLGAAVTDSQKSIILCHTTQSVDGLTSKSGGSQDWPNSFNAQDGKGSVVRQDWVTAKNGRLFSVSTLYKGVMDLKNDLGAGKPEDMKVLIVTDSEGSVTIRKQYSRVHHKSDKNITVTAAATYAAPKAPTP